MERKWDMEPLATKYWQKIRELEKQLNKALKRIEVLEAENLKLREENLQLRIENAQLKELLFGKPKGGNSIKLPKLYAEKQKKEPRPSENYRRIIPEKIDGEEFFEFEKCPDCDGDLKFLKNVYR